MLLFLEQRKENVTDKITPQAGKPLFIKYKQEEIKMKKLICLSWNAGSAGSNVKQAIDK
jgi:hypothetical protein